MKVVRNERRARSSSVARLKPDRMRVFLRASSSFLAPALARVAIDIALTRFAFRIVHHVGFSDRAAGDALSR
jgi:hypothetical protein